MALLYEISCRITKLPPCCGAKMLSLYLRLYIPPHKWLHPILKAVPGTWPSLGWCSSALCFSITSVLLLPTPAFLFSLMLSLLWAWPPFLCSFISPVPSGWVPSLDNLYKPSDWPAGPSLQNSVEGQAVSRLSCLLFCHFLDLWAVMGHFFPVPGICSCKLSSCLSNPVTQVNISTTLTWYLGFIELLYKLRGKWSFAWQQKLPQVGSAECLGAGCIKGLLCCTAEHCFFKWELQKLLCTINLQSVFCSPVTGLPYKSQPNNSYCILNID